MPDKFVILTDYGSVELEYDDVKTKKLTSFCSTTNVKSLGYIGMALWIITALVVVYDFFKDIARKVSSTKDLFAGKGDYGKFIGFTKGNITRYAVILGLFILGGVFFHLSSSMGTKKCFGKHQTFFLGRAEQLIKYNDQGKPVEIVIPENKA